MTYEVMALSVKHFKNQHPGIPGIENKEIEGR
jgi:hypothetical protein